MPVLSRTGLGVKVCGLGHYLPTDLITNEDLSKLVDTSDEWIFPRTGIRTRHIAGEHEATSDLATHAAASALESAGIAPGEIDLIIIATATPDSPVPPTAVLVQRNLEMFNAAAMDLSAACAGFVFAAHTGAAMIRSGLHQRVLVVGAETLTRMTNYQDRQSCILFGDAAGAIVLAPADEAGGLELRYSHVGADGRHADMIRVIAGGSRKPASAETVAAQEHFLTLKGSEVFRCAVETMTEQGRRALDELGLSIRDLRWVIPHQANDRIMQAVGSALGADARQLVSDIATVGNTSAASLALALSRLRERGETLQPGERVMLLTFGAGSTWGCQVYEQT
jgi:3-oxoacyl-[acyl-carrier-protein] synthase-3